MVRMMWSGVAGPRPLTAARSSRETKAATRSSACRETIIGAPAAALIAARRRASSTGATAGRAEPVAAPDAAAWRGAAWAARYSSARVIRSICRA